MLMQWHQCKLRYIMLGEFWLLEISSGQGIVVSLLLDKLQQQLWVNSDLHQLNHWGCSIQSDGT